MSNTEKKDYVQILFHEDARIKHYLANQLREVNKVQ